MGGAIGISWDDVAVDISGESAVVVAGDDEGMGGIDEVGFIDVSDGEGAGCGEGGVGFS